MSADVLRTSVFKARRLNIKLNRSEDKARIEHGQRKVTAAIARFRKRAATDPDLWMKLYAEADPYQWMLENDRAGGS